MLDPPTEESKAALRHSLLPRAALATCQGTPHTRPARRVAVFLTSGGLSPVGRDWEHPRAQKLRCRAGNRFSGGQPRSSAKACRGCLFGTGAVSLVEGSREQQPPDTYIHTFCVAV